MRSPSARVLTNRVTLSHFTPAQDVDGGAAGLPINYPTAYATAVPCSAQLKLSEREETPEGRVTTRNTWHVLFGAPDPGVRLNDMLALTVNGAAHTAFADGALDDAGRGGAFTVTAVERL